jgi:hypothetical protein
MLGRLPLLANLSLPDATAPDSLPAPPPVQLRPVLRSLKSAAVGQLNCSIGALHVMARWTVVADAGVDLEAREITSHTVAVKGWSLGWLCSALMLDGKLSSADGEPYVHPSGYALVDDADVELFGAALASSAMRRYTESVIVFLGGSVCSGSLRGLLLPAVPWLLVNELEAEYVEDHVIEWTGNLMLAPDHVGALLSGATGLQKLYLEAAALLDDACMWGLGAACPRLERLHLDRVTKVTAAGLLPLLTMHTTLRELELQMAAEGGADAGAILASLDGLYPAVEAAWDVRMDASQLTLHKLP